MWHMCAWFTTEDLNGKEQLVTFNIKQTILWRQTFPQIAILFPYIIYIYYNIHYYDSHILIHKIISLTFISNYDSHNPIIRSSAEVPTVFFLGAISSMQFIQRWVDGRDVWSRCVFFRKKNRRERRMGGANTWLFSMDYIRWLFLKLSVIWN